MMADKPGIYVSELKRYEAGTSQPTLEVFRKIPLAMNVGADVLFFGRDERGPVEDLQPHLRGISRLDPEEEVIKEMIEGMLVKHDA